MSTNISKEKFDKLLKKFDITLSFADEYDSERALWDIWCLICEENGLNPIKTEIAECE